MGTESGPPTKRLRSSLNRNVQLTECIREFKLPRQYPSMVSRLNSENTNDDKNKVQNVATGVACIPKVSVCPKIIRHNNSTSNHKTQTIKLKAKDGRDLGDISVQDLPPNIQGKTITIAKNGMGKSPEVIPVTDKTKGITIGVLTPVNLLKRDDVIHVQAESELPTVLCSSKARFDNFKDKSVARAVVVPSNPKKISTGVDAEGRPRVLVFQSGKNWHMVKIPKSSQAELVDRSKNNCTIGGAQRAQISSEKIGISGDESWKVRENQNVALAGKIKNGADSSSVMGKTSVGNDTSRVPVKTWPQPRRCDSTTDGGKSKSPVTTGVAEPTRPKIEVSRIFSTTGKKSMIRVIPEVSQPVTRNDTCGQKKSPIGKDVMVVLPSEKGSNSDIRVIHPDEKIEPASTSLDDSKKSSSSTFSEAPVASAPVASAQSTTGGGGGSSHSSAWRRKMLASKNIDAVRYSSSRDLTSSSWQTEKKIALGNNGERISEMTNNLSILEKALSTVEDEVLREKALKALAECGIGIERLVPIRPAAEQRPVKDSDTQTSIFGLWVSEQFIHVSKDIPTVKRIRITEGSPAQRPNVISNVINPNSQDLFVNGLEMAEWTSPNFIELTNMVEGYVKGNDAATQVANIFAKPSPVRLEVAEQLEKDFDNCKKYDDKGLLNIHNAVIADEIQAVIRYLMVLRACEESVDLPTRDGQTSLELAIRCDVSPKIVRLLLDAGAEPTSTETGHDSALIIASRQSTPMLMELIPYAKTRKSLDNYDSTGFAAVHYCSQNGYQEGVTALVRASADVNLRDRRSGRTPLFHAVENEHNDLAQMLLENGAGASIPNYGGQTIFNVIDETKHFNLLEVLNRAAK